MLFSKGHRTAAYETLKHQLCGPLGPSQKIFIAEARGRMKSSCSGTSAWCASVREGSGFRRLCVSGVNVRVLVCGRTPREKDSYSAVLCLVRNSVPLFKRHFFCAGFSPSSFKCMNEEFYLVAKITIRGLGGGLLFLGLDPCVSTPASGWMGAPMRPPVGGCGRVLLCVGGCGCGNIFIVNFLEHVL